MEQKTNSREFTIETAKALCPGYADIELVRDQLSVLAKARNIPIDKVLIFIVPQKRLLTVEEITNYTLFLASEKAPGITWQAVVTDGGYTAQ